MQTLLSRACPPRSWIAFAIAWLGGLLLSWVLAWTDTDAASKASDTPVAVQAGTDINRSQAAADGPAAVIASDCVFSSGACECEDPCLSGSDFATFSYTGDHTRAAMALSIAGRHPPRHRGQGPPVA